MMSVMNSFLQFMETNKSQFINANVDVSQLVDVSNHCTPPVLLKYTDPEAAFIDMPSVILFNFLRNLPGTEFPMYGLIALRDIVTKDVKDENSRIAMTLSVHLTKMRMAIEESATYYEHVTNIEEVTDPHIQRSINDLLRRSFGQGSSNRVATTNFLPIAVKIVHTNEPDIRGFAGINTIYINFGHFNVMRTLINGYKLPDTTKSNLLLIDIVTCAIHEYAHVRARQITNDLNHTTPNAILSTIEEADPEFGRMTERMFFGTHINWRKSFEQKTVSAEFIVKFLEAIQNNCELPEIPQQTRVAARSGPKLMYRGGGGADIAYIQDTQIE